MGSGGEKGSLEMAAPREMGFDGRVPGDVD